MRWIARNNASDGSVMLLCIMLEIFLRRWIKNNVFKPGMLFEIYISITLKDTMHGFLNKTLTMSLNN